MDLQAVSDALLWICVGVIVVIQASLAVFLVVSLKSDADRKFRANDQRMDSLQLASRSKS